LTDKGEKAGLKKDYLGKPTILIIDEDERDRISCIDILSAKDYRVETAESREAGIGNVRISKPDLVIVNIGEHGGEGLGVIEKIAEIEPNIVTVALTSSATVEYAVESMRRGAHDFLPKPVSPDKILLAVKRGLEMRRLASS